MSEHRKLSQDPDIRGSEEALIRAAQRALELGKRTHTPVWVLKDGKLEDLAREEDECGADAAAPPPGPRSDRR